LGRRKVQRGVEKKREFFLEKPFHRPPERGKLRCTVEKEDLDKEKDAHITVFWTLHVIKPPRTEKRDARPRPFWHRSKKISYSISWMMKERPREAKPGGEKKEQQKK